MSCYGLNTGLWDKEERLVCGVIAEKGNFKKALTSSIRSDGETILRKTVLARILIFIQKNDTFTH